MNTIIKTSEERKVLFESISDAIIESIGEVKHTSFFYWNAEKDFSDPFVYDCTEDKIENLDSIFDNIKYKPKVVESYNNKTFYTVGHNKISTVEKRLFHSLEHYYWALVHEHAHWTGDTQNLSRQLFSMPVFLTSVQDRAFEEIVAELSTRFIFELTGNITEDLKEVNQNYIRNMLIHLVGGGDASKESIALALKEAEKFSIEAVDFILEGNKKIVRKRVPVEDAYGNSWWNR